jgi:hypothetical protein
MDTNQVAPGPYQPVIQPTYKNRRTQALFQRKSFDECISFYETIMKLKKKKIIEWFVRISLNTGFLSDQKGGVL